MDEIQLESIGLYHYTSRKYYTGCFGYEFDSSTNELFEYNEVDGSREFIVDILNFNHLSKVLEILTS